MKHTWKKTVAACSLGLCLALSAAPCALATQSMAVPAMESAMPRYSNIRITPSLSINGGTASISVSIRPASGYEYDLTITLQKKGLIFWETRRAGRSAEVPPRPFPKRPQSLPAPTACW